MRERDPGRLDQFYDEMKDIHKKCFPDWRFGQLCSNFFGWLISEKKRDLFYPEESEMITHFREYARKNSMWRNDENWGYDIIVGSGDSSSTGVGFTSYEAAASCAEEEIRKMKSSMPPKTKIEMRIYNIISNS